MEIRQKEESQRIKVKTDDLLDPLGQMQDHQSGELAVGCIRLHVLRRRSNASKGDLQLSLGKRATKWERGFRREA